MERNNRVIDKFPAWVKVLIHLAESIGCPLLIYLMFNHIVYIENSLIFTLIFLACIVFGLSGIFNLLSYFILGLNGDGIPEKDMLGADDVAKGLTEAVATGFIEGLNSRNNGFNGIDMNSCKNPDGSINEADFRKQLRRAFEEADRYSISADHAYFENMKNKHNSGNKK